MSRASMRYLAREAQRGADGRRSAGAALPVIGDPATLRLAVIKAVSGSTYTVGVLDAAGNEAFEIGPVYLWGEGTLSVGARVLVGIVANRPGYHIIASAAGGGGSTTVAMQQLLGFVAP